MARQGSWVFGRALLGCLIVVAGSLLWSAAPAVAATFTVTNTSSSGPGSLAQAVIDANNDSNPPTLIEFTPGVSGIINLLGTLMINQNMTIVGPGASVVDVDGDNLQIVSIPSSSTTVSISGLEFSGGGDPSTGGAISNAGTLTVSDSLFADNHAGGDDSAAPSYGGAIDSSGTLTVSDSTFTDNAAGGAGASDTTTGTGAGLGGAIYIDSSGFLRVTGSTFTSNTAGGAGGGGIDSGAGGGGAIASDTNSSLTVTDSTLTANTAGGSAGGGSFSGQGAGGALILGSGATATLEGDTIDGNTVGSAPSSLAAGFENQGTASFVGTIVSGNTGGFGNCFEQGGTITSRDSLEGPAGQTTCGFDLPSADPLLGPLADNGGPTDTQAPGQGSPAIGVGGPGTCPSTDQRGAPRPSSGCDIGAYELEPPVIGSSGTSNITTTTASLVATVSNPDVQAGTVFFQYGRSAAYGTTAPSQSLAAGARATGYTASLSGLSPGTTYHFRVVAQDPDGTVYGPDQTFTASSPPSSGPSPTPAPPSNVFTFGKPKVGARGAVTLPVNAPDAGRFTAKATFTVRRTVVTHKHGKRVIKHVTTTFTYGTASMTSSGKGTFRLVIGLSPKAARELKLLGSRQVTIAVKFTPNGGTARTESKKVLVKRNRKGKYS